MSPGAFIQGEFSSLDGDCSSDYLVFKELGIDNARALYSGDYSFAAHLSLLGIVFPRVPERLLTTEDTEDAETSP